LIDWTVSDGTPDYHLQLKI